MTAIRMLLKSGSELEDRYELDAAEFSGTIPGPGDYLMEMKKDARPNCLRVVDRVFEIGSREPQVMLIVEEVGETYLRQATPY